MLACFAVSRSESSMNKSQFVICYPTRKKAEGTVASYGNSCLMIHPTFSFETFILIILCFCSIRCGSMFPPLLIEFEKHIQYPELLVLMYVFNVHTFHLL